MAINGLKRFVASDQGYLLLEYNSTDPECSLSAICNLLFSCKEIRQIFQDYCQNEILDLMTAIFRRDKQTTSDLRRILGGTFENGVHDVRETFSNLTKKLKVDLTPIQFLKQYEKNCEWCTKSWKSIDAFADTMSISRMHGYNRIAMRFVKVAKNGKKKGKKNGKNRKIRKDEEQEDDDNDEDHDEKADDDDNAVVVDNEDDEVKANDEKVDDEEKDGDGKPDDDYMAVADDKEEDHLNAIPTMMTVGKLFAKLKEQLETYFEEKQQDMSLHLSLKKETEMKEISLSGLAKLVIELLDE
ncbi:hypothetical protein CRE_14703 [Caenorhabditis remanei]|uniref:SPK domain-containing protein n=1 Tax=Caenorhabditis remanei TaxID=31234 RepID=E3M9N4_CAERE|nr:hypothetical protein CRE_14703 [Caenorhabditis remanei]